MTIFERNAQLIIHRGTNEIGGSCIEVNSNNTRLLFDLGLPLISMSEKDCDKKDYKLDIQGLYDNEPSGINGIFITHAHLDHFGLLEFVHHKIPIYLSKATFDILTKISPLLKQCDITHLNFNIIKPDEPVIIGEFEVIAHKVDHSIADSMAFEIRTDNTKILYTGDLRFHGRKNYLSENLSKIKGVDYLLMEGSTLGRNNQIQLSEDELMLELAKHLKNDKLSIITFSAQNLDRFISVYKACLKAKKTLVIDPYTCFVLETFKELSKNIPQFNWNNIAVYFVGNSITDKLAETKNLYKYKTKKISIDEIVSNPKKYLVKDNFKITTELLKRFSIENIQLIYSLWSGYLDKPSHLDPLKDNLIHCHTSGHSNIKGLQKIVETITPKYLIPIHTESAEQYESLFKASVILLKNREELNVSKCI